MPISTKYKGWNFSKRVYRKPTRRSYVGRYRGYAKNAYIAKVMGHRKGTR